MSDLTHILSAVERGENRASEELLPLAPGELNKRFNSAPAAICDSSPWNQGGPHCQDEESGKVTKEVTNGTCRLCVARFSSRHLILTTLDRANGSLSAEEAVFPSSASLPRASPPIAPGAY
jgi:hypothetical protein